jgi:hypothetical protein
MSPLNSLFRHEVEADRTLVTMDQAMQRRVAGRPFGRVTDLQDMFGSVFRVQPEPMHRPRLNRTNARAGREWMLRRLVEEMHHGLDTVTAADMDPASVLQAMNRFVTVGVQVIFGFINEDEGFRIDLDADASQGVVKIAQRRSLDELGFENAGLAMNLDKYYCLGHRFSFWGRSPC